MSDHFVRIVPVEAQFVPSEEARDAALAIVRAALPQADRVSEDCRDQVVLRDCGANLERIRCPGCQAEISIEAWQDWMSGDYSEEVGFRLAPVALPCCGRSATLDELSYEWPMAFSRYELNVMNVGGELPATVVTKLEGVLGCRLRVVRQHL